MPNLLTIFKYLLPLYIGAALGPLGGFGVVTLLPVLARDWAVDFGTASLAISFYMVPFIIVQIFSGSIAQLFDTRKALIFGFATYALGCVACGLSHNPTVFFISRAGQGLGAGFLTPIIMALIGDLVPEQHVGTAMGGLGVAYTIGVTLGPLLSGIIEVNYGWPFFLYFLAVLACIAGILYLVSSSPAGKRKEAGGAILDILPVLRQALMRPGVSYLSLAAFCLFFAYIGIMTFTADHLKSGIQLPSDQVGAVLSITGLSGIIVSPLAGFLGDRFGRQIVFIAGSAILVASIILMLVLSYSLFTYFILFLILGTGAATAWTSLNTMAVQVSTSLRKPVTSVYNATKFAGYGAAPAVLSIVYAAFHLTGIRYSCMAAVVVSSLLVIKGVYVARKV
ncbi:MAG: MFS transporter [bacterium]|nr:MFS transporter [bacterium]